MIGGSPRLHRVRGVLALGLALIACSACAHLEAHQPKLEGQKRNAPRLATPKSSTAGVSLLPTSIVGVEGPVALLASAADGSWVALCQKARDTREISDDSLQPALVVGTGPGEPIDQLLGFDPTGRFVAVEREKRLLLIDAHDSALLELGAGRADLRAEAGSYRSHRAIAFDASGARMLYLLREGARSRVVVRDLASGDEASIDPGPGEVWRAGFDESGQWVQLQVLAEDTNHSGRLEWPVPKASAPRSPCPGPIPRLSVWAPRGDEPSLRLAPSEGGLAEPAPDHVATFGDGWISRDPTKRLIWRRHRARSDVSVDIEGAAPAFEVASAKCDGRILHADSKRQLLLVACAGAGSRWPLSLVGPGYRNELGIDLAPTDRMHPCEPSPRLLAVHPGRDTLLLDLQARAFVPLSAGDSVLCTHESWALVERDHTLVLFDVDDKRETVLAEGVADLPELFLNFPAVFVSPLGVDVAEGRTIGHLDVEARPLALTRDGRVLLPVRAQAGDFATGPLRWASLSP